MTAGCALGAVGGAALVRRVPHRLLARGFAGLLAAVAGYLLLSAVLGGPPAS